MKNFKFTLISVVFFSSKIMKRSCVLKPKLASFHWGKATSVYKLASTYVGESDSISTRKLALEVIVDKMTDEELWEQFEILKGDEEVSDLVVFAHSSTAELKEAVLLCLMSAYNEGTDHNSWVAEGDDLKNLLDSIPSFLTRSVEMKDKHFPRRTGKQSIGKWMKTVIEKTNVQNMHGTKLTFLTKCALQGAFHMFRPEHAQLFVDICEQQEAGGEAPAEITNLKLVFQHILDAYNTNIFRNNLGNLVVKEGIEVEKPIEPCCTPTTPIASEKKREAATVTPDNGQDKRRKQGEFGNGGTYFNDNRDRDRTTLDSIICGGQDNTNEVSIFYSISTFRFII